MGLEIVKSNLKRSIIRKTVIIIVLSLIFLAAYTFATGVEQELSDVESKVSTLSGEILKRRKEYAQSEPNLKEYLAISRLKLPSENGYMLGRDRLKVSLPKVQILKDNYFFKKLNFYVLRLSGIIIFRIKLKVFVFTDKDFALLKKMFFQKTFSRTNNSIYICVFITCNSFYTKWIIIRN